MEIFKLFGSIMVDSAEAEKSISKTGEQADGLGDKLKNGIGTAAKWAAGITAGAVAVGGAMVAAAKDTAAQMDVIDKASQRMGVTAESYQELAYAAELSGVSMGTMEKAAKKLEGTNINFDDAMESILALETAEERAAAAADLFGESVAYDLTPMLNGGIGAFQAAKDEAAELGLVMSNEAVAGGAAMNDSFTKVEKSIGALKNGLMQDLMPYVAEILDWVIENLPMVQETVGKVMDAILPIVKIVLDGIMDALPPVLEAVQKLLDWIIPYLKPIMDGIGKVVSGIFKLINGDFDGFAEDIKSGLSSLIPALLGIGEDIMNALWQGFMNIWDKFTGWLDGVKDGIANKFSGAVDRVKSFFGFGGADGSHASGLNTVPYDGYKAVLHKGEAVLSAGNTQNLVDEVIKGVSNMVGPGTNAPIELTLNIDGNAFARATYSSYQSEGKRRGRSYANAY